MIRQIDWMGLHPLIHVPRNFIRYRAAASPSLGMSGSGYVDNASLLDEQSDGDTLI
jgi:hypothetical protein